MAATLRPWERTIEEYLGECRIFRQIEPIVPDLGTMMGERGRYNHEETSPYAPDYVFRFGSGPDWEIVERSSGLPVGAFVRGVEFIVPERRGRGLMAELYVLMDERGVERDLGLMTPASFAARKGAHRRHVERAIAAGLPVPQGVRSQYAPDQNGALRLRRDLTPEVWTAERNARRDAARGSEIIAASGLISERFFPECPLGAAQHERSDPTHSPEGLRAAGIIASDHAGEVRLTAGTSREGRNLVVVAFQAEIGGDVIDHFGVRAADDALADLAARGKLPESLDALLPSDPIDYEVLRFADEASCLVWLGERGYDGHGPETIPEKRAREEAARRLCDAVSPLIRENDRQSPTPL